MSLFWIREDLHGITGSDLTLHIALHAMQEIQFNLGHKKQSDKKRAKKEQNVNSKAMGDI